MNSADQVGIGLALILCAVGAWVQGWDAIAYVTYMAGLPLLAVGAFRRGQARWRP